MSTKKVSPQQIPLPLAASVDQAVARLADRVDELVKQHAVDLVSSAFRVHDTRLPPLPAKAVATGKRGRRRTA